MIRFPNWTATACRAWPLWLCFSGCGARTTTDYLERPREISARSGSGGTPGSGSAAGSGEAIGGITPTGGSLAATGGSANVERIEPAIDAGYYHTCLLGAARGVKCWGMGTLRFLGSNSFSGNSVPHAVVGMESAVAIAAGGMQTCVLLSDESVHCWGPETLFTSGDAQDADLPSGPNPIRVSSIPAPRALATGGTVTCAVLRDQTVRCWDGLFDAKPATVATVANATGIARGARHACALLGDATVRCWGSNDHGQLGNGTMIDATVPVPVSNLGMVAAISLGTNHSCALLTRGQLLCWGANETGQLGDGTTTNSNVPVEVLGVSDAVFADAGGAHTCALLSDSTARCWGSNGLGQLGTAHDENTPFPSAVLSSDGLTPLAGLTTLAAGTGHTCATTTGPEIYCWGDNLSGQLGRAEQDSRMLPAPVEGL